jgi:hypothetical protein
MPSYSIKSKGNLIFAMQNKSPWDTPREWFSIAPVNYPTGRIYFSWQALRVLVLFPSIKPVKGQYPVVVPTDLTSSHLTTSLSWGDVSPFTEMLLNAL